MTVRELIKCLKLLEQGATVHLASDSEGNRISVADEVTMEDFTGQIILWPGIEVEQ